MSGKLQGGPILLEDPLPSRSLCACDEDKESRRPPAAAGRWPATPSGQAETESRALGLLKPETVCVLFVCLFVVVLDVTSHRRGESVLRSSQAILSHGSWQAEAVGLYHRRERHIQSSRRVCDVRHNLTRQRQTERQTETETDRQRQTDRQTDRDRADTQAGSAETTLRT
jgi:hypothetical protein